MDTKLDLLAVGAFMAGWPFANTIESYSWTTAFQLLEICGVVMVMFCVYLLVLMIRGLTVSKKNG